MTAIAIVAHAPLATAFSQVGGHCYCDVEQSLHVVDVTPDDTPATVAQRLRDTAFGGDAVLVLTDAQGATPSNGAELYAAGNAQVRVVHGLNAPMLWRTLCYRDKPLPELAALAEDGGMRGIRPEYVRPIDPNATP